jgi:transposase
VKQDKFECVVCGFKENADINAARNISIPEIDQIIKDSISRAKTG